MPRKPAAVTGLTWRNGAAYWQRTHAKLPAGRVVRSLGVSADRAELAGQYAGALNNLMERGDWNIIARWVAGELHVTDIARAVREGDYSALKRLNAEGLRLGDVYARFMTRMEATRSERRVANVRSTLDALVDLYGADLPMHMLTREQAEAFLHAPKATIGGQAWAAGTQIEARTIAKALWTFAHEIEAELCEQGGAVPLLTSNPWRRARVPTKRPTRFAYLQKNEARALLAHPSITGTPVAAFLALGIFAGLRTGEIRHLRMTEDVDMGRGKLRIQSRKGDYPWRPKSRRSERDVPIAPALAAVLAEHIERGYAGTRYLIRTVGKDRPISKSTGIRWVELAFEDAGLRYGRKGDALTAHSLRHTFGTWLVAAGIPIPTVAKLMGNSKEVCLNTYAHHIESDEGRAIVVIEQAAAGGP